MERDAPIRVQDFATVDVCLDDAIAYAVTERVERGAECA
jgi:hypothetical protein